MIYIGIDPGKNGGIAWQRQPMEPTGEQSLYRGKTQAVKMPQTEQDLWQAIASLEDTGCRAIIEKVHASPRRDKTGKEVKNGAATMFKFGQSYGSLRMALIAAGIPFDEVTPQKWQRELGLIRTNKNESSTDKKNRHKAKAQQLFPELNVIHATADALLIAEYCRRVNS